MSVIVDLPARMSCNAKDCTVSVPVGIMLLASGGFAFRPPDSVLEAEAAGKWQILALGGGLGPYETNCPAHHRDLPTKPLVETVPAGTKLQVGPRGPRLVKK